MKKILSLLSLCLFALITSIPAQVYVETFPMDPQSGPYNYFGVRVTLPQTYNVNITVNGYIYDEGEPNTNNPFSLTVNSGYTTEETSADFYQTCPTCNAVAEINTIVTTYAGVTITFEVNNNILKFNSLSDVNAVLDQLDEDYDNHHDYYESQMDTSLTADQLDSLDIVNGFDEFKTFRDFESLFPGYSSKRAEVESTETSWLANEFSGTDPDDVDLTFDDSENTIFNSDYKLKIGSDLYQLTSAGVYKNGVLQDDGGGSGIFNKNHDIIYAIENLNNNKIISGGPMQSINYMEFEEMFFNSDRCHFSSMTDCKSNKKKRETTYFSNNTRRMDLKVAINSIWVKSSVKAKAVNYKKNGGNWKRSRTKMAVSCAGTVYNGDCSSSFQFSKRKPTTGYKKRKQLKVPYRSQLDVPGNDTVWKTYSGLIAGGVDAPDLSFAGSVTLTF